MYVHKCPVEYCGYKLNAEGNDIKTFVDAASTHFNSCHKGRVSIEESTKLIKDWANEAFGIGVAPQVDTVNHPSHYTQYPVEVIELTECMNFNRGNAVKYICRAGHKKESHELTDLHKAAWYIAREIKRLSREV